MASSSPSSSATSESLRSDLTTLQQQLAPVLARDRARIEAEGRPFDLVAWVAGAPDSHKYPGGPAFLPLGKEPTLVNSVAQISSTDLAWTGAGAAAFYAFGYANASRLGVRSLHAFGLWTAVPAVILGLMGATHRGWYRYMGFTSNGNPPLYPGYVETAAPYFMRHHVSDRHFQVSPTTHVHGLGGKGDLA